MFKATNRGVPTRHGAPPGAGTRIGLGLGAIAWPFRKKKLGSKIWRNFGDLKINLFNLGDDFGGFQAIFCWDRPSILIRSAEKVSDQLPNWIPNKKFCGFLGGLRFEKFKSLLDLFVDQLPNEKFKLSLRDTLRCFPMRCPIPKDSGLFPPVPRWGWTCRKQKTSKKTVGKKKRMETKKVIIIVNIPKTCIQSFWKQKNSCAVANRSWGHACS